MGNRGNALLALRRFDEALASYDRAIELRLDSSEIHTNRGNALHELKRHQEALASYDRALALRPDHIEALANRGVALLALERFEEALAGCDRALALQPDFAEALCNRGLAQYRLTRFAEALASHERALALRPDYAEAHYNRANALLALERLEEALAAYDHVLTLRANYPEALLNRGSVLEKLKRFEDALASYDRAIALRPNYAEVHANRGIVLEKIDRFEESLASYGRALALQPDNAGAHYRQGVALEKVKRFAEALAHYGRAITLRPDYADAHHNEALCRLLTGDLRRGFAQYEWRWQTEQLERVKRRFPQKLWRGSDEITGKTILLHAEQGFGDTIQFCRYVPRVAERAAHVILEVQKPLQDLMRSLPGAARIVSKGEPLPDFDLHCPFLNLPVAFGTELATIPSATPYLQAHPSAVAHWDARLGPKFRRRIGLAWAGHPTHLNDHNRSMRLDALLSATDGIDATFVSLQRQIRDADTAILQDRSDIFHFGEELHSFSDTTALIASLDLVISVDTSVAHLAGALAKPVWVLLPFIPDWRWLLDQEDSPWYPTARLFQQDETRAWGNVMKRVHAALQDQFPGT
ncbi:MAG TPA: tetratricopeptide repeat protein [Xanthobacteraceae bacterium]|nr:tetratricopeptide repeat protein [Xanthobacteraceae bacterium]